MKALSIDTSAYPGADSGGLSRFERDEGPPTPSSDVSEGSSAAASGAFGGGGGAALGGDPLAAAATTHRRQQQALPSWLQDANVNEFTERMARNDAPEHVKYMQNLVECLGLLGKIAPGGAILSEKLRSTVRELIVAHVKEKAAAAEAARPRLDHVGQTGGTDRAALSVTPPAFSPRTFASAKTPGAAKTPGGAKTPGAGFSAKTPGRSPARGGKWPATGGAGGSSSAGGGAGGGPNGAVSAVAAPSIGPSGPSQMAAQELLESVMTTLIKVLENHVLVSSLMEAKAGEKGDTFPSPSEQSAKANGVMGGGGEAEAYHASTGGYSVAFAWSCIQSECQQLICDVLRATPDGSSADAATARLANLQAQDHDGSWEDGLSFSFRFVDSGLGSSGEGIIGALGGDGLFHSRNRRQVLLGQEGYGTAAVLPERGIYLTSACYRPVLQFTEKVCTVLPPPIQDLGKDGLRPFIDSFVKDQFLPSIQADYRNRVADALNSPSAFRPKGRGAGAYEATVEKGRPVLQGPLAVEQLVIEVLAWAQAMPVYASEFVHLVHTLLDRTLERCRAVFTEATLGSTSSGLIGRVDIEQLMRQQASAVLLDEVDLSAVELDQAREDPPIDTEAYELDQQLYGILFDMRPIKEVMLDVHRPVLLAALSDSLHYLADSIFQLGQGAGGAAASSIPAKRKLLHRRTPSGAALTQGLAQLSDMYLQLSRDCLRTLRLEMQLQTIFFLQTMSQRSYVLDTDAEEPEDFVVSLTSQLSRTDEEMAPYIALAKRNYVFGGVCSVAATGLIKALGEVEEINQLGVRQVQRNCIALQQTLATLGATGSSSVQQSLDRVGEYYELLNRPYEALMAYVRDHDRYFSYNEYAMLLQVYVPGRDVPTDAMQNMGRILAV